MKKLKILRFEHTRKNIIILILCFVAIIYSLFNTITCFCAKPPNPWVYIPSSYGLSLQDFYDYDTNVIEWNFGKNVAEPDNVGHINFKGILKYGYNDNSKVAAYVNIDQQVRFCIFDSDGNFINELSSTYDGIYIVEEDVERVNPQNMEPIEISNSNTTQTSQSYSISQYYINKWDYYNTNVPVFDSLTSCKNYALTGSFDGSVYVPEDMIVEKPLDLYVYADNENKNILTINWKQNDFTNLIFDAEVGYKIETVSMNTDFAFIPLATNKKPSSVNELTFDVTPILDKALLRDNAGEDKIYIEFTVNNKDINHLFKNNRSTVILKYTFTGASWSDGSVDDDNELINHPITNKDDFISGGGSSPGGNVVSSGGIFSQLTNGLKSIISTKDGFPALIASAWSGLPPTITSILVFGFLATIVICLLAHILKG